MSPYAYQGTNWFGYDDVDSVRYKAQYAKDKGFGGAFVYSVESDDFLGKCQLGKNPLTTTISRVSKPQPNHIVQ